MRSASLFPEEAEVVVADDQELEIESLGNGVDDGHEAGNQIRAEPTVLFIQNEKMAMFLDRELGTGDKAQTYGNNIADGASLACKNIFLVPIPFDAEVNGSLTFFDLGGAHYHKILFQDFLEGIG